MGRFHSLGLAGLVTFAAVGAATAAPTLILPFRTIGVSDTTAAVFGDLLGSELETRAVEVIPQSRLGDDVPRGATACDDIDCANAAATTHGAERVVYGSLSRLGEKIIVRVRAVHAGSTTPDYADQLTAAFEEDLDAVARRVATGLASGLPNAENATIDNITAEETFEPRRRASRGGLGIRAGFLFPVEGSYGGVDRLTTVRVSYKYETDTFLLDTTPVLGFAWRGDTVEWTILDIFAARIFGKGDWAPYLGAGFGVHSLNIETTDYNYVYDPSYPYYYGSSLSQTETTLTADIGVGLLALRTYDFVIVTDLRYHVVFSEFDRIGGDGAHGVWFTFGFSH